MQCSPATVERLDALSDESMSEAASSILPSQETGEVGSQRDLF
jgi:hypothetical protein